MRIAIIGSGGREHAICEKIYQSKKVKKIFCIPGNGGTYRIAKNIQIDLKNLDEIKNFLINERIDLTIVGPEGPLVDGIVDFLTKFNIKVFGPDKFCSKLEGSKIFTKKICKERKIPTAKFKIFKKIKPCLKFLKLKKYPLVVKADGLASGKGVYICNKFLDAKRAVKEIFGGKFGSANEVLIEEFLDGEEMSFFILYDNKTFKIFNTAQDHKRVFEGDKGKNTGGMGAYSPSRLITKKLEKKIINKIILPTLKYLKSKGGVYIGFLYAGLMIKKNKPYLIEYNVRMGDPECQTILPRLKTDLLKIIINSLKNRLNKTKINWTNEKCMTIVLCSKGYPGKYTKNKTIKNINKLKLSAKEFIYHAGTKLENNKIISSGGRVLNVTSTGKNFLKIRNKIFKLIKKIDWKFGFYRRDIGWKVINKNANN